jgi:alanine racemase
MGMQSGFEAGEGLAGAAGSVPSGRPTWAEIDLRALVHNFKALSGLLSSSIAAHPASRFSPRIIPVIKADAYGHGASQVARSLAAAGAKMFAVALVEEGIALRKAGISQGILVLDGSWPGQEKDLLLNKLIPAVSSLACLMRIKSAAEGLPSSIPVHIQIDTGMARAGIPWDDTDAILKALSQARHIQLAGTFSHFSGAEEEDLSYTREQIRRFEYVLSRMRHRGLNPGEIHLANSAGLIYCAETRQWSGRPGIALYGYAPSPERCQLELRPVLTLKSRIGDVRTIQPGESVGYNRRFVASRVTRLGNVPIGYADGYNRALTGRGRVIIRDRWAEVLGAVSMDMIVVDLSNLPEVHEGEEITILGSSANCRMDARAWAELLDTIPYEVLCALGPRVPRIYFG